MNSLNSTFSVSKYNNLLEKIVVTNGTIYSRSWTYNGNTYTNLVAFTNTDASGTIIINANSTTCAVLIAAGGAGGGCSNKKTGFGMGGGGAGGLIYGTIRFTSGNIYSIGVGKAGSQSIASTNDSTIGNAIAGGSGGNSIIVGSGISETAFGGGRGGYSNGGGGGSAYTTPIYSGKNGGSGGGTVGLNSGGISSGTASAGQSSSTNTRSLTYAANGCTANSISPSTGTGGGGATSTGVPGTNTTGSTTASRGGIGYLFSVTGTSNDFINKYYCNGGSGSSLTINETIGVYVIPDYSTFISTYGGAGGGTLTQPIPDPPTAYGSGGGGSYSATSTSPNYNGGLGTQGIVIILVP